MQMDSGDWGIRVSIPRDQSPEPKLIYFHQLIFNSGDWGIGFLYLEKITKRERSRRRGGRVKIEKGAYPIPQSPAFVASCSHNASYRRGMGIRGIELQSPNPP
jgi:hypothetical protein